MDEFEIELKMDFIQEAKELLESCEQSFLELEKDPSNSELIDTIFRFAHNLKGTSRAVGFGQIAELTHKAESLLLEIKNGKIYATDRVVSTLLSFNDMVREMIEGLGRNLDETFSFDELMNDIESIITGDQNASPATQKFEDELKVEAEFNTESPDESISIAEEEVKSSHEEAPVIALAPEKKQIKKERKDDETLRVSLNRLEKLNDLVGELVILQTLVESSLNRAGEIKTARGLGKLCKDIQDLSMSLRMVTIGQTFQKLTRVVRDASMLLGKKVDLRLVGEDTEIDKTVVESLGDPLVHIIRNAIDHGIESPEERVISGKPEHGTVEAMAFHEGNFLVIQITDDGKGIDGQKLVQKAKEKGIIPQHLSLNDQQGIELIFHPGFSTKEQVSELSGRGVGMDVVKTNIESLGGEVKVRSKPGVGSCFRLMLPLTLAIIEGMIVESAEQTFVVPKGQVQEVIRIDRYEVTNITGRTPYLRLRQDIVPLFYLDQDLGAVGKPNPAIAIVVKHGDILFTIGITDVLRQQQVVVKPPTRELVGRAGIMGTTILGDGRPALIVDLVSLYGKRVKREVVLESNKAA